MNGLHALGEGGKEGGRRGKGRGKRGRREQKVSGKVEEAYEMVHVDVSPW